MDNHVYKRIARVEALAEAQKAEFMDVLKTAYERACEQQDEEDAANYVRQIRNKLLAESDARMSIDRFGLTVPSGSTFTVWLYFLRSLGNILLGDWAKYRQALRDLPEQQGFPFNVEFPTPPENEE